MEDNSERHKASNRASMQFSQDHKLVAEQNPTNVVLNKWQLLRICDRLMARSKVPRFEDCLPWLGMLVAFLFALIPTDFQDYLGLSKNQWESLAIFGMLGSGARFLYLFWLALKAWWRTKEQTSEQFVEDLIREMRQDQGE